MDAKTILILVLIGYLTFWYNSPEKGREYIETGVDKTKELWTNQDFICTQQYDPVCAGGITYNNQCLASKAGMVNITIGVCI